MTQKHGMRPDAAVKEAMAASIVSDFPCLKDPEGSGHAAFYTKGQHKRPAFGWLEDHLRYICKKGKKLATEHLSVSTSQNAKKVPSIKDEKKNLAFFLLPLIFQGRAKNRGSCTTQSSLEAFIDQQPTVTSVENYCKTIQKEEKPQPFILSLGCNKASPQQTFVIIERNPVIHSSLVKAVDYRFKSHYVFDVNFQAQCKGFWEFFHSEVYDLGRIQCRSLSMFRAFQPSEVI
ncbi:hypothetical protein HOLleu_10958 [Holothuria leucospilota]|uniref:Uncharacterized protein n=1 Tax=Holothuria leucospilota TaxID=206669 RepID=A0A9Q1CFJ0_HOLLE|nr:hypothetical protein HOLleu_10958 [Holothuria leucospilota]